MDMHTAANVNLADPLPFFFFSSFISLYFFCFLFIGDIFILFVYLFLFINSIIFHSSTLLFLVS